MAMTQRQAGQVLDDLVRQGAEVQKRSKNVHRITFPDSTTIVVHSSPSDVNWYHHLRRATIKAGLHWPGEDRKQLKAILREASGRSQKLEFITEYGAQAADSVSQDAQDRLAKELSGKSEARIPVLVANTGMSQPTITKALIRLGWLQHKERKIEKVEVEGGKSVGAVRAYWGPAPETVLKEVVFKGKGVKLVRGTTEGRFTMQRVNTDAPKVTVADEQPVITIDTPQVEEVEVTAADLEAIATDMREHGDTEALADLPIGGPTTASTVPERNENEWFAEAERLEQRAISAEQEVALLRPANELLSIQRDEALAHLSDVERERDQYKAQAAQVVATEDPSWSIDLTTYPDELTLRELIANAKMLGLVVDVRVQKAEVSA